MGCLGEVVVVCLKLVTWFAVYYGLVWVWVGWFGFFGLMLLVYCGFGGFGGLPWGWYLFVRPFTLGWWVCSLLIFGWILLLVDLVWV